MGLPVLRIVQVGDIHLPDEANHRKSADIKDASFPAHLTEKISASVLELVLEKLQALLEDDGFESLIFMGDLTSFGDIDEYKKCVQIIREAFIVGRAGKPHVDATRILIGNHEVVRKKELSSSLFEKFKPFDDELKAAGFSLVPHETPDRFRVSSSKGGAEVYALNSCIGCGEKKHLPSAIRDTIAAEVATKTSGMIDGADIQKKVSQIAQSIDTPLISTDAIESILKSASSLSSDIVPVICAHHNFLPQTAPRVEIYTELVNGGQLRARLLEIGRPVVYLHGHLHDDPIDIVRSPKKPDAQIICVSAPLMRDGFNSVQIASNKQGTPIGCKVVEYRMQVSGVWTTTDHLVPLWTDASRVMTDKARKLLNVMDMDTVYYPIKLSEFFKRKYRAPLEGEDLREAIEELYWLALAEVTFTRRDSAMWKVTRRA